MMYPYLTLDDETEIVHSEMLENNTVKVYMNQIYSRLGVHSRDEFYQKIKHHHSVE